MLKDAAEAADGVQGGLEGAVVVADAVAPLLLYTLREPTPPLAGRMRHHRPRAFVQPRVACLVPDIDAGKVGVHAFGLNEQRGHVRDHATTARAENLTATTQASILV